MPPVEPKDLEIKVLSSTEVGLKFAPPQHGEFDYFVISFSSAYGHVSFEYPIESDHPNAAFYHKILQQLRPGSHYKIMIYTVSKGVKSVSPVTRYCTTLEPDVRIIPTALVLTGDKKVCALDLSLDDYACDNSYLSHQTKG